ncbi:MAG: YaiO family outer membrane beta-barrel protein [Legionellaceae bacterium]|nr:YaiO family outer membrane beta-barrel protein [Legionellaceae bacterium]
MFPINYRHFFVALIGYLVATNIHALKTSEALTDSPQNKQVLTQSAYDHLSHLYRLGAREEAIVNAIGHLQTDPRDVDVRYLLGTFYYQQKNYLKTRQELTQVLQETPSYSDASMVLIHLEMAAGHYQNALAIVNASLLYDPVNPTLLDAKTHTQAAIDYINPPSLLGHEDHVLYPEAPKIKSAQVVKKTIILHAKNHGVPNINQNQKTTPIKTKNEEYLNELGTLQQNYYISDVNSVWNYSTLYYGRETGIGKIFGKINYAERLGYRAIQGEIEAYPKLNKYIYLDIDYAFAHEPNLFPDESYGLEAYVTTKKAFDFSVGAKYNIISFLHQFYIFTVSASKLLDNNQNIVTFRPYFYAPSRGPHSTLYTLNIRHTITDPYFYFGCIIGAGTSPDLANLETVDFILTQNKLINPYINFSLYNDRLAIRLSGLFQNQVFPSFNNRVRNWSGGAMNLAWKF